MKAQVDGIWSEDKGFLKKDQVRIYTAKDLVPVVSLASLTASILWSLTADTVMNYLGPLSTTSLGQIAFLCTAGCLFS
jgi:hypothetical protein